MRLKSSQKKQVWMLSLRLIQPALRWVRFCVLFSGLFFVLGQLDSYAFGEEKGSHDVPLKRVLIGSILNHRPEYMREFFLSLHRHQCSQATVDYFFVNTVNETVAENFVKILGVADETRCHIVHASKEPSQASSYIWMLADYKDRMISYARDAGYDYLFLVDSDVVLHPKTLDQLMVAQKDIVSDIIWTVSDRELEPQVWLSDQHNQFEIAITEKISDEERERRRATFFNQLKVPGTYEVGGLGVCTLISKKALHQGVSFQRIKIVTFTGEDRHFCLRAAALGIPLFVDTHFPAYRILRDTGDSSLAGVDGFVRETSGLS